MTGLHIPKLLGGALCAILAGALVLPAMADTVPSYAVGTTDETIHGTVASVNGPTSIMVRDARGFTDNVTLHRGTIINPTGLMLEPGQTVTILGETQGRTFSANEIDTPYQAVTYYPAYGNFGFGYGYPYGRVPYPFYGAGFGFHRGFGFGVGI